MELNNIKAFIFTLLVIHISGAAFGQDSVKVSVKSNIIKINLSSLVFKNISLQYERKVAKKISVALNVHSIPFGHLPFLSSIEKAIDDSNVPVNKLRLGSLGFTPEIRFYLGKKEAFRGFYFAPFLNITRYKIDLPVNYGNANTTAIFIGNVAATSGGLLLGAQWSLGKSIYLDWWILGPNYGGARGDLNFNSILSVTEQDELRTEIADLKANGSFTDVIESYSVNDKGAFINVKGPWAGLRGLGLNLGIQF